MKSALKLGLAALILAAFCGGNFIGSPQSAGLAADIPTPAPALKTVKYKELCKAIIALKGQIVVVDFWQDS